MNLEAGGLSDALADLTRRTNDLRRVQCAFECPHPVLVEDSTVARHLFRIAQEAVNNALKHSQAKQLNIRLTESEGRVRLEITDDGKGLPKASRTSPSIGLQVMRHRAALLGAELAIESKPGKGVKIICLHQHDHHEKP